MKGDPFIEAAERLAAAGRVLLGCHVNPDGDTLGSALALALALRAAGKQAEVVCADPVPRPYRFLPGSDTLRHTVPAGAYDLGVILDCDGPKRLGSVLPAFRQVPFLIEVDHHPGTERFGQLVVVDTTAAATAEPLFTLLKLGGFALTAAIATCLYVAILTDTGSFRFANTTGRALRLAAELVACGAHPGEIAEQVYASRSFASVALLGRALASLQRSDAGALAWAHLTPRDFTETGSGDADTEGIVHHLRDIEGVRVAALFRQIDGKVRVSLRSREPVNVAAVARVFGGGGHRLAAGCTLAAPLDDAERRVLDEARKALG